MSRAYAALGDQTALTNADASLLSIEGGATDIAKLFYLMVSNTDTPADQRARFNLNRCTADGTGTSVTPEPLDAQQIASNMTVAKNHTGEPTYTANKTLLQWAQNARAIYQFFAHPNGEIWTNPSANNGVALRATEASTASTNWEVLAQWIE